MTATLAPAYVGALADTFGFKQMRVVEPETVRKVRLYRPAGRAMSPAVREFADFLADVVVQGC
jgi:DNA-binding transcriptional LysR family regulator